MHDDFRELDNTVIWGNEACGAAVPSTVWEVQIELGVYVAVGRIVTTTQNFLEAGALDFWRRAKQPPLIKGHG